MPRATTQAIIDAQEGPGISCDLIHLATDTPFSFTNNAWDLPYDGKTFLATEDLIEVDPGAMTAGIHSNSWELTLSAMDNQIYSGLLAQQLHLRWVYHYIAWFNESATGIVLAGIEPVKYGQIVLPDTDKKPDDATVMLEITSQYGDADKVNCLRTNSATQHRRFGADDNFFKFAQENKTFNTKNTSSFNAGGYGGHRGDFGEKHIV